MLPADARAKDRSDTFLVNPSKDDLIFRPATLLANFLNDFVRVVHNIVADSVAANLDIVLLGYFKHFRLLHAWMELNLVHSRHYACVASHFFENISWVI